MNLKLFFFQSNNIKTRNIIFENNNKKGQNVL